MNIKYRPEIDGLRAIAVVAVILYHAKITILGYKPFQGGFVGVDIFFVISGYLITSIILQELIITGTFSFKYFYERRIRRILPALLLVITVSLPFAWIYLLPTSFIDFSKSIIYSLGFGSNFYFHYSGQIYGADSGLLKPFLHTWSLSVEEQFYIIFPIILLIIFKYFRKYLGIILIIGFMTSLILADWTSRNYPSTSFYLLHTRMWELLAGSILGYFEMKLGHRASNRTLHLILPTLGLFFIALSIIFFNDKLFHPSFYTLSAVVGVCLIIWFSHKDEIVTKILSTKLFVGIGLISYSLYLWNYPIFAFARMSEFTLGDNFKKILLALLILLLSVISYYFVEKPARNKYRSFKIVSINIIFIVISLILVNSFIIKNNGFNNRLKYPEFYQEKATYNYLTSKSKICFNNIEICKFNNEKQTMETITDFFNFEIFSFNDNSLSIFDLTNVIVIVIVTKLVLWIISKALFNKKKLHKLDKGSAFALFQIIKYLIWIIAITLILESLGIKVTILLAGSAALLVGVGLGLQQTFNDILSGIILLLEHSVKVGDILEIDGDRVVIQEIGLRTSKGMNVRQIVVIIPNSLITTNKVINWSHQTQKTLFNIDIGVAYGSDVDLVIKTLEESAIEHLEFSECEFKEVRFVNFGNSSMDFQLYFYSKNIFSIEKVKSDIRKIIYRKFNEHKITIPFPQMDLHIKSKDI